MVTFAKKPMFALVVLLFLSLLFSAGQAIFTQSIFAQSIFARSITPARTLAATAERVELNPFVKVTRDYVTLADLFMGLSKHHDHVIAEAPAAGDELVLNAATLSRIARSFGLPWAPSANFVEARIVRDSTMVDVENIHDFVLTSLQPQLPTLHDTQHWQVTLEWDQSHFYIPADRQLQPMLGYLRLDERTGRFISDIRLFQDAQPLRLRGNVQAMVNVPVPIYSLEEDQVIRSEDLHFLTIRKDSIAPNVQVELQKIVGKTPKRLLRADAPIAIQYLQDPLMVQRKRLVSVVYNVKNLTLVTKGMAITSGSLGEVVQVKNLKSNRIIDSVVTGYDEVSVSFSSG